MPQWANVPMANTTWNMWRHIITWYLIRAWIPFLFCVHQKPVSVLARPTEEKNAHKHSNSTLILKFRHVLTYFLTWLLPHDLCEWVDWTSATIEMGLRPTFILSNKFIVFGTPKTHYIPQIYYYYEANGPIFLSFFQSLSCYTISHIKAYICDNKFRFFVVSFFFASKMPKKYEINENKSLHRPKCLKLQINLWFYFPKFVFSFGNLCIKKIIFVCFR